MEFKRTNIAIEPEILENDHVVTKPITLDFTSVTDLENGIKVVKAGSPISAAGVVDNSSTPVGILWKNVYESRPIGALIVHGFINKTKAEAASGLTLAVSTWGALLPQISFM